MRRQKRPFENGDFDENDDVDQNSEKFPSPMRRQRVPPKKVAKMARNRNGDFEGDDKFAEHG